MKDQAVRITTVGRSRSEDLKRRQRNYLLAMSLRSLCFVSAALTALAGLDWLWPYLIGGAIILPYFAVVAANNSMGREPEFSLETPRRELEAKAEREALSRGV